MTDHTLHEVPAPRQKSRRTLLWCCLGIIAFFLITEHWAHLFGVLPYLLLLACPLMHLFMHHGHAGHSGHDGHEDHTGPMPVAKDRSQGGQPR